MDNDVATLSTKGNILPFSLSFIVVTLQEGLSQVRVLPPASAGVAQWQSTPRARSLHKSLSSNGRTGAFDTPCLGSNPSSASIGNSRIGKTLGSEPRE